MFLSRLTSTLSERGRTAMASAIATGLGVPPGRIPTLLAELVSTRALLTIALSGTDDVYTSAALECVTEGGYLVIDELMPGFGNACATPGRRVSISGRLHGGLLAFESTIDAAGTGGGIAYYRIPFPRHVEYRQRREYFRAVIPVEQAVPVQMVRADGRGLSGELRDISRGGLSLRLDPGPTPPPRLGEVLPRCLIAVPVGAPIATRLEICYSESWNGRKRPRLGGRFVDVDRRAERELDAYVTMIDREYARRTSRR